MAPDGTSALEHFDWTGRWRDKEFDGSAIDTTGDRPMV